tara:strand:+ start:1387 stop:2295 length:909 start_codon:yes stop_codon:yes gene_type:complete
MRDKDIVANFFPSFKIAKIRSYITLTKPRLLLTVIFSAVLGYFLPLNNTLDVSSINFLIIGTALLGGGANTINQWQEKVQDSRMKRTKNRPLPKGTISSLDALLFGIIISIVGFVTLWLYLNLLTAIIGLITFLTYTLVYTPLKQKTVANTWIGGITGALPPVMGWVAARGQLDLEVFPIFTLLYFWQLPHFFAIAWMYREDYEKGGFRMLTLGDKSGEKTAIQMLLNAGMLFFASLGIYIIGQGKNLYLAGSSILSVAFVAVIIVFCFSRKTTNAKNVFLVSIIYLPVLGTILIFERFFLV